MCNLMLMSQAYEIEKRKQKKHIKSTDVASKQQHILKNTQQK